MENNEKLYIGGLLVLAMILTGSVTYYVVDTGEEITCRTGNGWEVVDDYGDYMKAVCQYKTKEWEYALCSDFRATNTYPRYGCKVVALIEKEYEQIPTPITPSENSVRCIEKCDPPSISDKGCYCI